MKIKTGDKVKILSGKDRGKVGKVVAVDRDNHKVIVEGINIIKRHLRQTGNENEPGGRIEKEAPISASKVMLICPNCSKPSRTAVKRVDGKKVRVCKKCEKEITSKE